VQQHADVKLHLSRPLQSFSQTAQAVTVQADDGPGIEGDALIGADGVWSMVRQQLLGDGLPRRTGHLAYRALVRQSDLPKLLRSRQVTAWLGPRMHVVQYPVRGGEWLNVVAIVHGEVAAEADLAGTTAPTPPTWPPRRPVAAALREVMDAIEGWRLWVLHDRAPMQGAHQHAVGRVACWATPPTRCAPTWRKAPAWRLKTPPNSATPWLQALDPALDVPDHAAALCAQPLAAQCAGAGEGFAQRAVSFMPMGCCGGGAILR
jgi:salicylate hydroxylase